MMFLTRFTSVVAASALYSANRANANAIRGTKVDGLTDEVEEFWERTLQDTGSLGMTDETTSPAAFNVISNADKYDSLMWGPRKYKADVTLGIDVFDENIEKLSKLMCDGGVTATLFDQNGEQIYQKTYGTNYEDMSSYRKNDDKKDGWTGDTTMAIYSNSKTLVAAVFLAAVVDAGLGFLDEPMYLTFPEYLSIDDTIGRATPRMILSHSSGIAEYQRDDPLNDPYYSCKYNENTTFSECLGEFLLTDTNPPPTLKEAAVPGSESVYKNAPFDVLGEIIVRKTGLSTYAEALQKYITGPLGMDSTTLDCPGVGSTASKPNVAWGVCSTAHDMAKFVQVVGNKGKSPDGTQIISEASMHQMFSDVLGNTPLGLQAYNNRCINRVPDSPGVLPDSIYGYGLGTMIFLGAKGFLYGHAASTGGFWFVSPGKFSGYIGNMQASGFRGAYPLLLPIIDKLEVASTIKVICDTDGSDGDANMDDGEEIGICGDGIFIDQNAENEFSLDFDVISQFVPPFFEVGVNICQTS